MNLGFHQAIRILISIIALIFAANATARDFKSVDRPGREFKPIQQPGTINNPADAVRQDTSFLQQAQADAAKIETGANPCRGKAKWECDPEKYDAKIERRLDRLEERKRIDQETADRIQNMCNAANRNENRSECAQFWRENHKYARPDPKPIGGVGGEEKPEPSTANAGTKPDSINKPTNDPVTKPTSDPAKVEKPENQATQDRQPELKNDISPQARQGQSTSGASDRKNEFTSMLERMEAAMGGTSQPVTAPTSGLTATPATTTAFPGNTNSAGTEDVSGPMFRTEDATVNTGTARSAMQCQNQASQAAQTCQQALANVQSLTGIVYRAQMAAASTNSAGSCSDMGNAASSAGAQMQQQQQACASAVSACEASCGSAKSATSNVPESKAYIQASTGISLCMSAGSSASTMSVNIDQVKVAAVNGAQCYEQLSGQKFVPQGAGAIGARRADQSLGASNGATTNTAYHADQGADSGEGSLQELSAKGVINGEEQGGGAKVGNTRGLSDSIPDLNSKFQATTFRQQGKPQVGQQVAAKPGQAVPAKNPGFFIRDAEAERRAKEYSRLPSMGGAGGQAPAQQRVAQRPNEMERFMKRNPTSASEIGSKHTNIFQTITQRYARNQDYLKP